MLEQIVRKLGAAAARPFFPRGVGSDAVGARAGARRGRDALRRRRRRAPARSRPARRTVAGSRRCDAPRAWRAPRSAARPGSWRARSPRAACPLLAADAHLEPPLPVALPPGGPRRRRAPGRRRDTSWCPRGLDGLQPVAHLGVHRLRGRGRGPVRGDAPRRGPDALRGGQRLARARAARARDRRARRRARAAGGALDLARPARRRADPGRGSPALAALDGRAAGRRHRGPAARGEGARARRSCWRRSRCTASRPLVVAYADDAGEGGAAARRRRAAPAHGDGPPARAVAQPRLRVERHARRRRSCRGGASGPASTGSSRRIAAWRDARAASSSSGSPATARGASTRCWPRRTRRGRSGRPRSARCSPIAGPQPRSRC